MRKTVRTSVERVWDMLTDNEKMKQWFEDTKTLHYKRSVLYLI
ncbi:MAG: SRPBCC domain-containing protein [Psychrobacillus psychrotolerans]